MPAAKIDAKARSDAAPATIRKIVLETLIVTVIAAAMGSVSALGLKPPSRPAPAAAEEPPSAPAGQPAMKLLDLPPIVTNLGAPTDTWIRLEVSLLYDAKVGVRPEAMGAEIAGDLLAYLRTVTVAQLEGPIGLQNIRQDLNERASIRSEGVVRELIIRTLVVQ
jgi:flagellar FliL protein